MQGSRTEIARRVYAAINTGELELIAELLDPQVSWHGGNPDDEHACHNREQALQWIRTAAQRRGGRLPELVDVVESGDRVVVVMQPPASAGDPHPRRTANLATFRDGRVIEMVQYADADAALAALAAR